MVLISGKRACWVEETGRVIGPSFMPIEPRVDMRGFKYVELDGEKRFIHDLVLEHHGEPPGKSRPAQKGELPNFLDGNKKNTHINNLEWITEEALVKRRGSPKKLGEEGEERIYELVIEGKTYKQIREIFAREHDLKVNDMQISAVKKKFMGVK